MFSIEGEWSDLLLKKLGLGKMWYVIRFTIPLIIFLTLVVFFILGLGKDPNLLPSMLVTKPVPNFNFPQLEDSKKNITQEDFRGQITLLNVWATWCTACQMEHPILIDMVAKTNIKLYGLNYKDDRSAALNYLEKTGNPYTGNLYDPEGKLAMQFGVYGTPETFIIDKKGVVRYRCVGPITIERFENDLLPRIKQIQKEG